MRPTLRLASDVPRVFAFALLGATQPAHEAAPSLEGQGWTPLQG